MKIVDSVLGFLSGIVASVATWHLIYRIGLLPNPSWEFFLGVVIAVTVLVNVPLAILVPFDGYTRKKWYVAIDLFYIAALGVGGAIAFYPDLVRAQFGEFGFLVGCIFVAAGCFSFPFFKARNLTVRQFE